LKRQCDWTLGANPFTGKTPLHRAVAAADGLETVRLLLGRGAEVDRRDACGVTPLMDHVAAHHPGGTSDGAVASLLLESGASVALADGAGKQALHHAAEGGDAAVVARIIDAGGDARATSAADKRAPLHWAAYHGRREACLALLAAGADPNQPDDEGCTAMHLVVVGASAPGAGSDGEDTGGADGLPTAAAEEGTAAEARCAIIAALHNAGARIDPADLSRRTPAFLAARRSGTPRPILAELLRRGAACLHDPLSSTQPSLLLARTAVAGAISGANMNAMEFLVAFIQAATAAEPSPPPLPPLPDNERDGSCSPTVNVVVSDTDAEGDFSISFESDDEKEEEGAPAGVHEKRWNCTLECPADLWFTVWRLVTTQHWYDLPPRHTHAARADAVIALLAAHGPPVAATMVALSASERAAAGKALQVVGHPAPPPLVVPVHTATHKGRPLTEPRILQADPTTTAALCFVGADPAVLADPAMLAAATPLQHAVDAGKLHLCRCARPVCAPRLMSGRASPMPAAGGCCGTARCPRRRWSRRLPPPHASRSRGCSPRPRGCPRPPRRRPRSVRPTGRSFEHLQRDRLREAQPWVSWVYPGLCHGPVF
jgi:ankyrin repeat protein